MDAEKQRDESRVSDRYSVTIPASIRDRFDIESGDILRWSLSDAGKVTIEPISQESGVFDDFEPVDSEDTHASSDHSLMGIDDEDS